MIFKEKNLKTRVHLVHFLREKKNGSTAVDSSKVYDKLVIMYRRARIFAYIYILCKRKWTRMYVYKHGKLFVGIKQFYAIKVSKERTGHILFFVYFYVCFNFLSYLLVQRKKFLHQLTDHEL